MTLSFVGEIPSTNFLLEIGVWCFLDILEIRRNVSNSIGSTQHITTALSTLAFPPVDNPIVPSLRYHLQESYVFLETLTDSSGVRGRRTHYRYLLVAWALSSLPKVGSAREFLVPRFSACVYRLSEVHCTSWRGCSFQKQFKCLADSSLSERPEAAPSLSPITPSSSALYTPPPKKPLLCTQMQTLNLYLG